MNKKFATLRAWNRKRNYLMKDIKYYVKLFVSKIIWDNKCKNKFNVDSIKTVLLLRNEGKLGDMIVDTILLRELNDLGYQIDVLATEANSIILKYNPYVRSTYIAKNTDVTSFMKNFFHNVSSDVIKSLRNNKYDLVIDPSLFDTPIHRLSLFNSIKPMNIIGFNKRNWLNCYNKKIDFNYDENHIKFTYELIMNSLNTNAKKFNYDIFYPYEIDIETKSFVDELKINSKKIIIINTFAGSADRCLSIQQLKQLTKSLYDFYENINIVFLDHEKLIDMNEFDGVYRYQSNSLYHTVSLISKSDVIISPDTSIVHMSAAFDKPLVAIYQDVKSNKTLWGPGYDKAIQVLSSKGRLYEDENINELIIEAMIKIYPTN
jgi:ADP-heptose:LPS heptosyltransferase